MSTKTTFKRVAAVAAAALAISGFSAVSANAGTNALIYVETADGISGHAGTKDAGNGVAGPVNTVQVGIVGDAGDKTALTGAARATSDHASIVTVSGAGATITKSSHADAVVNTLGTQAAVVANNNSATLTIATPQVGTITVQIYQESSAGLYSSTPAETVTITVGTVASNGVLNVANSSVLLRSDTSTTTWADFTDATVVKNGLTVGNAAQVLVVLRDGTAAKSLLSGDTITAVVSGPGLIQGKKISGGATAGTPSSTTNAATFSLSSFGTLARVAQVTTDSNGGAIFNIQSDGTAGTSTITFTDGTTTLGTKTIVFSGKAAGLAVTQNYKVANVSGADLGNISTPLGAVTVSVTDAAGNAVVGASIKGTSSDTTVLSSITTNDAAKIVDNADGTYDVIVNAVAGVASGKSATITFTALDGTTVLGTSSAVTFSTGAAVIYGLTLTLDSANYNPGDKATATLTAVDKYGNPVADKKYDVFVATGTAYAGLTTSASITSTPFSLTTASTGTSFVGGVATSKFYMPIASGPFIISGTTSGASADLSTTLKASGLGTALSATTAVASDPAVQAATDAAQEATDAANAAYDAANNAMDSADAATAAAQDASDNASAALAAVTSLAATVAKLVKSIAAITAAVAKIQKKIGA